ncbi:MAG: hypothetical protein SF162_12250 [bacterium]|nr:hypothetical protein [bacterium]
MAARRTASRPRTPGDHVGVLFAAALMMAGGWVGLYLLVTTEIPRVGPRWLFFVLLHIAITGTVLPIVRYFNVRFTPVTQPLPPGGVIVRQSVWIGLFVVTCAWLQMPRALNWGIAFFVALAFLVTEIFLRTREIAFERDRWR